MSHRAGIRDYGLCLCFPIWEYYNTRHLDLDTAVARVSGSRLRFAPGTDFAYTSLGFNLVGAAVVAASDEPFERYVQRAVAAPLGLVDTGLDAVPGAELGRVAFYDVADGRYKPSWPVDNSIRWPSGGFLSTPTDLVRLGAAMLDDRLLSEPTRRSLVVVPPVPDTEDARMYAHGWRSSPWTLFDGAVETPSYHHNGTAVGSTSVFVVLPEQGLVVSVLMNRTAAGVGELAEVADELAELFWERGPDPR
jgi:serine beta-lactamase-like protein LACTB